MATRSCNLECVKDKAEGEAIEFVGPVKIVLVDQPPNIYRRRVWGAAFIVLAQMMMAATTMTVLFYAFSYERNFLGALHVFLCTVGYQLCVPSAILSLNKQNGSAAPMRIEDRQFEHLFLQFFGVTLAIGATMFLLLNGRLLKYFSLHAFVGLVTGVFAILTTFSGLLLYGYFGKPEIIAKFEKFSRFMSSIHRIFGCLTFLFSSLCFLLGIWRPRFKTWVPVYQIQGFLLLFCVVYTAVVLYRPLRKLLAKMF